MEKRTFARLGKTLPATLKIKETEIVLSCQTLNISRTGAAIRLKKRIPGSAKPLLYIHPDENTSSPITAEIQPVWNKSISNEEEFCYGLRFTEVDLDNSLALRRLLGYEVDHIVTGSYLPEKVVTNEDIVKMGFKGPAFVLARGLGAKERRCVASGETNADMLANVGKEILQKAGVLPTEIDRIICAADPGDAACPDTACAAQAKIGANCPAFGISMSCTGWIAGIDLALGCLERGEKKVLVLASCLVGSRLYYHNLMHRAIFGDGAGGVLLEAHHKDKFLTSKLWTKGEYYSKIYVPYTWSSPPKDIPEEYKGSFYMYNEQQFFFSVMDDFMMPLAENAFNKAKIRMEDINLFFLHYPSKPLFEHSLKVSKIPREKTFDRFKYYGNLVAAEMPVFLNEATKIGRVKEGDLIYMLTYGAGITAGELIFRY